MGIRIALDAMGTDGHPQPEVGAALEAGKRWGDPILLVGPKDQLSTLLSNAGKPGSKIRLVQASQVLRMTDKPADAARDKPDSSMAVGMELVKRGEADAFVTMGNAGGAMANALFRLGRLRGVKRPGLAYPFPTRTGHAIVLDIGVNTDAKPEHLVQYAILGAVYSEIGSGIEAPRVGLLSNGEEPGKGNLLVKETFPLLEATRLNFIGNVEAKEVYAGAADVVVTDGFTGNVFMKTSEAVASFLTELLRREIGASTLTALGGLLARPAFRRVRPILDASEHGAGVLLGVRGLVFIGHGRFKTQGVVSGIRAARNAVERGLMEALRAAIESRLEELKSQVQV